MRPKPMRKEERRKLRGLSLVAYAALFAAQKHRDQLRKDGVTPYVVHPVEVLCVLTRAGIRDSVTLAVALLHDTLEETLTTIDELQRNFGSKVARSVLALTDDRALSRSARKRLQVGQAGALPKPAKLVRLADKAVNILSFAPGTSRVKRRRYLASARKVREALRGVHRALEDVFDRAYHLRMRALFGQGTSIRDFLREISAEPTRRAK